MAVEKFTEHDGYEYGEGIGRRDDTGKYEPVWYRRPIVRLPPWEYVPEAEAAALVQQWTAARLARLAAL